MKKFLNKIVAFLKSIFTNLDAFMDVHVTPSIELTKRLIAILESPVANIITALIPGDADDKLKNLLLNCLHKAIDTLHISADIANDPDWTSKIYKTLKYIESLSPDLRQGFLRDLTRVLIIESAKQSNDPVPEKSKHLNLLIESKLNQLSTSLEVVEALPKETIVNGELQTEPVAPPVVTE